ncbi:hypothetical protein OF846_001711 [Rhodotorula toruloides]|nr:hypothetical protein OF846_001711 [Rhodotorula toruloides]
MFASGASASRPACGRCSQDPLTAQTCDGEYPCLACAQTGSPCRYPPPPSLNSAWTSAADDTVQRWSESMTLVPGMDVELRLSVQRDDEGESTGFRGETMVAQHEDLRLHVKRGSGSQLFPATVDDRDEAETVDLTGDPFRYNPDGTILRQLHANLPNDPLHPAIHLNAVLRSRPPRTTSRILSTFEPTNPNLGNAIAALEVPLDQGVGTSTSVAWRTADKAGGRATGVGWGTFTPAPRPQQSAKGKGRAGDAEDAEPAGIAFAPSHAPLFSATSPIQQLQLAPLSTTPTVLLAVRSLTSLDLLHLHPHPPDPPSPHLSPVLSRFTYTALDFGRRPIADVAFGGNTPYDGGPGSGLVVDTEGSLFGWGLGVRGSGRIGDTDWNGGRPEVFHLRRGRKKGIGDYSGMARVEWGGARGSDAVVALQDEVLLYDLRSPSASLTLLDKDLLSLHLPFGDTSPALVTSLLQSSPRSEAFAPPTSLHVICTTRDLLWLDERMPGREVLRRQHGRVGIEGKGSGYTLSLLEFPPHANDAPSTQRIALHSRLHPQIEVLTTDASPTDAPRSVLDPYFIHNPPPSPSFVRAGLSILPTPTPSPASANDGAQPAEDCMDVDGSDSDDEDLQAPAQRRRLEGSARPPRSWQVLEVGTRGDVHAFELSSAFETTGDGEAEVRRVWSEDVQMLADEAEEARRRQLPQDRPSESQLRSRRVVQLRDMLQASVLGGSAHAEREGEEEAPDKVLDEAGRLLGDCMATNVEGDVGGLTGFELIRLARLKLDSTNRTQSSESLSPTVGPLPRQSAYTSSARNPANPFPLADSLASLATAHIDLHERGRQQQFSCQLPTTSLALEEDEDGERKADCHETSLRRDLWTGLQVLLPRSVEPDEPTLAPNQPQPATEDQPPLHFSYLRPRQGDADSDEDAPAPRRGRKRKPRKRRAAPSLEALGARLLAGEWHVGADPRSYAWHNPYEGEKNKDDVYSQSQRSPSKRGRKARKREGTAFDPAPSSSSQPFPADFGAAFPSSSPLPASSQAYFPSLAPPRVPPTIPEEPRPPASSQDWTQLAATQPAISIDGPSDSQTQSLGFGGAASQVVPGSFGSRLAVGAKAKDKKKGKKRTAGF